MIQTFYQLPTFRIHGSHIIEPALPVAVPAEDIRIGLENYCNHIMALWCMTCLVFAAAMALATGDTNDELLADARKGDLQTVKTRIEDGAPEEPKTSYGQTPLYLAAVSGPTRISSPPNAAVVIESQKQIHSAPHRPLLAAGTPFQPEFPLSHRAEAL
jgi:hypothetical protein